MWPRKKGRMFTEVFHQMHQDGIVYMSSKLSQRNVLIRPEHPWPVFVLFPLSLSSPPCGTWPCCLSFYLDEEQFQNKKTEPKETSNKTRNSCDGFAWSSFPWVLSPPHTPFSLPPFSSFVHLQYLVLEVRLGNHNLPLLSIPCDSEREEESQISGLRMQK